MDAARRWPALAALGSTIALVAATAAIAPGASAATPAHNCGTKNISIEIPGAPGAAPTKYKIKVEAIRTQGVSCQAAYKFLEALYKPSQAGVPDKYKCATGKFKAPPGKVPELCTRPGAKIQFAGEGG